MNSKTQVTLKAGFLICALVLINSSALGNILFSNLGQGVSGTVGVRHTTWIATDFQTGVDATMVTGLTLKMQSHDNVDHTVIAEIYSEKDRVPGTLLGTFESSGDWPQNGGVQNVTLTGTGIILRGNQRYWLVVHLGEPLGNNTPPKWQVTGDSSDAGSLYSTVRLTRIRYTNDSGAPDQVGEYINPIYALQGTVIQGLPVEAFTAIELLITAPDPYRTYLLQGSDDMLSWTTEETITGATEKIQRFRSTRGESKRFWRLVEQ